MADSLHTRYRPTTFDEVVGHVDIVNSLRKVVKKNRAHTFLFSGPAGTGKTSLARILANEFAGGNATAANIEEIPAALCTGIDSVRAIADKANYRAIGASPTKTIILDEAHRLSTAAWDGLLKATEEPPSHVYYVFCTTNVGKVPKTILTRCQQYELLPLEDDEVLKILKRVVKKEKMDLDIDIIETIAECANGSARQALQWLESCQFCESAKEARSIMKQAGEGSKEVIDLCRYLINPQGRNWTGALKILNELKDMEAESIRIVICNYFSTALLNTKSDKNAKRLMHTLDCFSGSYHPGEKFAPLLLSIGAVLGMND